MKEVFLALKEKVTYNGCIAPLDLGSYDGYCACLWLHDTSKIAELMNSGWHVFSCDGFKRILEVEMHIKLENKNGNEQCT